MSNKESKRFLVIEKLADKRIKQKEAAKLLGCSVRRVKSLYKAYKKRGLLGLISKKRGKPSNRKYSSNFRETIIKRIQEKYNDFGPTLASEMLLERDQLNISKETARLWMIESGIWLPKSKNHIIHQPRDKRPQYGALIQIDGSPHDWFEGRSEPCTLIVFVDDATSKIQLMRFFPAETTFSYFQMMRLYIERYGLPCALYSDKHSIFRINTVEPISGTGLTQFGRAMKALEIELIYAHSPQAKGRVERKNRSLQDRLIKTMRLDGINNMEMANGVYLDHFAQKYNAQFATAPKCDTDLHRPLDDLTLFNDLFTIQHDRKISKNLTVSYKGDLYKIKQPDKARRLYQAKITVCENESGKISILYKGQHLPYELYKTNTKIHNSVKTRKEITADLARIEIRPKNLWIPPLNHPWRQYQHKGDQS